MVDNDTTIHAPAIGPADVVPIASDDIGGVRYQRIKAGWGADGVWHETQDTDADRVPVGGAQIGSLIEGVPANDTASSGLNGRLQRIAQRLTTLITVSLPAALAASGGLKVAPVESSVVAQVGIGATLSAAVDMAGFGKNLGLVVPSTFDGTQIQFQVSVDNGTYQGLYDAANNRVQMTVAASRSYDVVGEVLSFRWLKIECVTAQATTVTDFVVSMKS